MNTTPTTLDTTAPTASRRGRRFTGFLIAALATIGCLSSVEAPTASAAGTGNVTFCLRYSTGSAYSSKPVYLYYYDSYSGSWIKLNTSGSTASNGCATWRNVPTGYHYATQGYWTYNVGWSYYAWSGFTGSAYLGNAGTTVRQATGTVNFIQIY